MKLTCRDLASFGVPLIASDAPEFFPLVREIAALPQPFGPRPADDPANAAVLLNQSGKSIITFVHIWRYRTSTGVAHTNWQFNLGSSRQFDFLSGRGELARDPYTFVLPGSKRLLTERGVFGNNFDVLGPDEADGGGGMGSFGGGRELGIGPDIVEIELVLDLVIFEDGLCAGPDEAGMFEGLSRDIEDQRKTAEDIAEALRRGASLGQVFETLRPLARHQHPERMARHTGFWSPLLRSFANNAIHKMVQGPEADLLPWFDRIAESKPLRLHRPRTEQ